LVGVMIPTGITVGILAGAGLDQVIKQLPARKRIGVLAYSKYFMAADLANGRYWYGMVGILAYLLTLVSAITGFLEGVDATTAVLLLIAAGFAIVHAFGTSQAAPTAFRVRGAGSDENDLTMIFDRFSKWTTVRGIAGLVMLAAMISALVTVR
jgi:hypothetical protein